MNNAVYYITFTYWILSSILAVLSNGFIIFISYSMISSSANHNRWSLKVDQITVISILYLAVMDFMYGLTLLMIIVNDIVLLGGDRGESIFGAPAEINAPIMLMNYRTVNNVLNRINVMSWTANIIIILLISMYRLG